MGRAPVGAERIGRKPASRSLPAIAFGAAIALVLASDATAAIPPTLHSPGNCTKLTPAPGATAWKCDDGLPGSGGTTPNLTGASAITVPARYQGYQALPPTPFVAVSASVPSGLQFAVQL